MIRASCNFNTDVEGSPNSDLAGFAHDGGFGLTEDPGGFRRSPAGPVANIEFAARELDNIARFLRALDAPFNVAQALERLAAAVAVARAFGGGGLDQQGNLMRLAMIDLQDAVNVLNAVEPRPDPGGESCPGGHGAPNRAPRFHGRRSPDC